MPLDPRAILRVYNSAVEVFGQVVYAGDAIPYDLPGLMGTPGASYQGFQRDPTGSYLMQQMVPLPFDCPPSAWVDGDGAALGTGYSYGTSSVTGKKFLYYGLASTGSTQTFSASLSEARDQDEGFQAIFYIAAGAADIAAGTPGLPVNFYIEFSRGRDSGETGLRLAFEPGSPIRLQASIDDDATWTDVASADALGECEAYLTGGGRYITVNVLSECDASWYSGLPETLAQGGQPPSKIVVSLGGGDAILTFTDDGLAAGSLGVTGQNRQWHAETFLLRFSIAGLVTLAPQTRPEPLQSTPTAFLNGYVPASSTGDPWLSGNVLLDSPNSAHAEMTLTAEADETGYAARSCFLSTIDAEFPPIQIDPVPDPGYVDYEAVYSEVSHGWDQTISTARHVASVLFTNESNQYAPGVLVDLAVRAARLYHSIDPDWGLEDFLPGTTLEEIDGVWFALEMTGYTAMEEEGQGWNYEGGIPYFRTSLSDRLVHTEGNTAICAGFQLPYDYQCQYYAFGQQAYRAGFVDGWWTFPIMLRNQPSPPGTSYYYLDGGTSLNPVHRFQPSDPLESAMEHIRAAGAEFAPGSPEPQPMVISTSPDGSLNFYGLPVGVIDCLLGSAGSLAEAGLESVKTFSKAPAENGDGLPSLNEFLSTWESRTSLRRVRTPVVLVGIDPQTATIIFGVAYNEAVGGGPYADPSAPGYIGINKPLYVISRLFSSQAVADLSAQKASVLLAVPAVDTGGNLFLQPGLQCLSVIGVQDYTTQGTTDAVGYYLTHVTGIVDRRTSAHRGETTLSARELGLAA